MSLRTQKCEEPSGNVPDGHGKYKDEGDKESLAHAATIFLHGRQKTMWICAFVKQIKTNAYDNNKLYY